MSYVMKFLSFRKGLWVKIRAHLCTLGLTVCFNCTWRLPNEAFHYGGLVYGLGLTLALVLVAQPVVLMQMILGRLSQRDTIGVWKAVPIFKGIGYLKLLTTFFNSVCGVLFLALSIWYSLYTTANSIPFPGCTSHLEDNEVNTSCLESGEKVRLSIKVEYFEGIMLIAIAVCIVFTIVIIKPVRFARSAISLLGPLTLVLILIITSNVGRGQYIVSSMSKVEDWNSLLRPQFWLSVCTQALLATQVAGGFLVTATDTVYSKSNPLWISLAVVLCSIVSSWVSLIIWFSLAGVPIDGSKVSVLTLVYDAAAAGQLTVPWAIALYAMLVMSGLLTMFLVLYPFYYYICHTFESKWRWCSVALGAAIAAGSAGALAGWLSALRVLDDVIVALLACTITLFEILAILLIYGINNLFEDLTFLIGIEPPKKVQIALWFSPVLLSAVLVWWGVSTSIAGWTVDSIAALTTLIVALTLLITIAIVVIQQQIQYDFIEKIRASFRPSRYWGPRDPVSHYYWLNRRNEDQSRILNVIDTDSNATGNEFTLNSIYSIRRKDGVQSEHFEWIDENYDKTELSRPKSASFDNSRFTYFTLPDKLDS